MTTLTKLYQLVAKGPLKNFEGSNRIYSRKVFTSKEAAIAHMDDFKKICEEPINFLTDIVVETIKVVELELVNEIP